ncbi:MAG: Gfa-like protein, partial [uncultured Rubellimicrobium sp.]
GHLSRKLPVRGGASDGGTGPGRGGDLQLLPLPADGLRAGLCPHREVHAGVGRGG